MEDPDQEVRGGLPLSEKNPFFHGFWCCCLQEVQDILKGLYFTHREFKQANDALTAHLIELIRQGKISSRKH